MMEEIDFELCLGVEKHAAIARREKMTSSFDSVNKTTTPDLKSPRLHERQIDEHEQRDETYEHETKEEHERCAQSNKRTKISASGSWREGDQTWPGEQAALHSTESSFSSLFSSSSTETVDMSAAATSRDSFNGDEKRQGEEQSNAYSPLSSTFRNLHIHEYGAPASSDSGFTIYEDPEDRVIRDFGFYIPEDWYRYPEDDKENTDTLDEDEDTSAEESESFEGEEIDHQRSRRRQHFDHSQDMRMYYYHDVQWSSPNISVDEYTDTGGGEVRLTESNPRHRYFDSRTVSFSEDEDPSSFREVRAEATETMSFLGAPPRRFLGRGRQ